MREAPTQKPLRVTATRPGASRAKGGLGSASTLGHDGLEIGALVADNPRGSVVMSGSGCFWAWPLEQGGQFGGRHRGLETLL